MFESGVIIFPFCFHFTLEIQSFLPSSLSNQVSCVCSEIKPYYLWFGIQLITSVIYICLHHIESSWWCGSDSDLRSAFAAAFQMPNPGCIQCTEEVMVALPDLSDPVIYCWWDSRCCNLVLGCGTWMWWCFCSVISLHRVFKPLTFWALPYTSNKVFSPHLWEEKECIFPIPTKAGKIHLLYLNRKHPPITKMFHELSLPSVLILLCLSQVCVSFILTLSLCPTSHSLCSLVLDESLFA